MSESISTPPAAIQTPIEARRAAWQLILSRARALLRPPPKLALSEWADRKRQLTRENTSEPGQWRTSRVPALREIMDAITDPHIETVVFMKPSRIGATEALIVNAIGYFIEQDPSPVLVVQPTMDDAAKFSKEKLRPMLESTPAVGKLIKPPRAKDSENTILNKKYAGGKLGMIGTNAPRLFRQRDFRVVLFDEIDAYRINPEGDPVALGKNRAANFDNRKFLEQSSPTLKGASRIEAAYENSDQRKWFVTCPHCGHEQQWKWEHLRWEKEELEDGTTKHLPETAYYACAGSGCVITEAEKLRMNGSGRWIAQNPGHRVRGYHCSAQASNLAGAAWPKLVTDWITAQQSPELLQAFVNTVLAETFEFGQKVESDTLLGRREVYDAEVPLGVGVLTAMVDVHDDRLEVLVRGWGIAQESWRITHEIIWGNPDDVDVWATLDGVLFKEYQHEGGAKIRIRATVVDAGHKQGIVYAYVKPRQKRGVWAMKGDKQDPTKPLITRTKKPNDLGVRAIAVGTFHAKRRLFDRLHRIPRKGVPSPGSMHFNLPPGDREQQDRFYMKQFEAEKLVLGRDKHGQRTQAYIQVDERNEAIDLEAGAYVALFVLGAPVYEHLDREVERMKRLGDKAKAAGETETTESAPRPARSSRRGSSWVGGWRR